MTPLPSPWTWWFSSIIQLLLILFPWRIVRPHPCRTDSLGIFLRSKIFCRCGVFAVQLCRGCRFFLIDIVEISFVDDWTCVSFHVILVGWIYVLLWWTFPGISESSLLYFWLEHQLLLLFSVSIKLFHQSFVQCIFGRTPWRICFVKRRRLPWPPSFKLINSLWGTQSTCPRFLIDAVVQDTRWLLTLRRKRYLLKLNLKRILHLILSFSNGLGLFRIFHCVDRSRFHFRSYRNVLILNLNLYWIAADRNTMIVIIQLPLHLWIYKSPRFFPLELLLDPRHPCSFISDHFMMIRIDMCHLHPNSILQLLIQINLFRKMNVSINPSLPEPPM